MVVQIKNQLFPIKKGVKIVINNSEQLKDLISASNKNKIKAGCAVHIDTGMNNLVLTLKKLKK